ncbi:hypothetical protein [Nocardiopsis protaetiae]|uniref:hypothetical protein n=1 Tax=Nocardiopsis protaetiae TaxID=3382270 RepID=UPI00387B6F3D
MRHFRPLLPATAALLLAVTACTQDTAPPAADPAEAADGPAMAVMAPVIEAARAQPVDGGVWHQERTWGEAWGVGPEDGRYGVYRVYRTEEWSWTGAYDIHTGEFEGEEAGLSAQRTNETTWELVDERHRAAWERDGSPEYWPYDPVTERVEIPTREEGGEISGPQPGGWNLGAATVDHPGLQELPPDPSRLEEALFPDAETGAVDTAYQDHLVTEHGWTPESGEPDEDTLRFLYVGTGLSLPFPPEVRAGVYTVLAGLPGVRPIEEATDVSGRAAVGVAYTLPPTAAGTVEQRLLFDPETGHLLSREAVVTEPSEAEADWSEPGDVVEYTLYGTPAWIEEPPL